MTDSSSKPTGKQYVVFFADGRSGVYENKEGDAPLTEVFYRRVERFWTCWKLDWTKSEKIELERKGTSLINLDLVVELHET